MSDNEKRRFKTTIDGVDYTFIGNNTDEHMQAVADLLNEQMEQIKDQLPDSSKEDRAILAAFNAISNQLKLKEQASKEPGSVLPKENER
ncbi:cell division protein ZapA [Lentilactobacillus sp. Marseille-Q4993]|uniref:cell division protein ZapA n=1 Tax=Lentilactobacillus sp. Marseille-Q4993 TaxID=3039492 RepID=UPI0024BC1F8C|nr:cell division protein ZapA [Lentilactobacillus sp. Marseille-Q4993]